MLFARLPNETILRVLEPTEAIVIRRFQQVCRRFRDLVTASSYLQYRLELDMCGYAVPSVVRSDLRFAEMTDALRKHRQNWQRVELSESTFIPDPLYSRRSEHTTGQTLLVNGIYAASEVSNGAQPGLGHSIHFRQFPSSNRGTGLKSWHHVVPVQIPRAFTIEPEQDLLVILEEIAVRPASEEPHNGPNAQTEFLQIELMQFKLHLRTMSTNKPHPAVSPANTEISFSAHACRSANIHWFVPLRIYGRLVVAVFNLIGEVQIVVHNWLTGQQIAHLIVNRVGSLDVTSIWLLSEDLIVVPHFLHLNWYPPPRGQPRLSNIWSLGVYKISSTPPTRCIARFILPAPHPSHRRFIVNFRTPSVAAVASLPSPVPKIFESLPSDSEGSDLLHINIRVTDNQYKNTCGILLVPSRAMSSVLASLESDQGQPTEIPWETWAHHTTWLRFGGAHDNDVFYGSVYGQRLALGQLEAKVGLRLWDFHPNRMRAQGKGTAGTVTLVGTDPNMRDSLDTMFAGSSYRDYYRITSVHLPEGTYPRSLFHPVLDEEHVIFGVRGTNGDPDQAGMLVYGL